MQQAASVYAKVATATLSSRELEATVLLRAASRMQAIHDDWPRRRVDLDEALTYNRKLWTVLVTSATDAENPLPKAIKQNVANLAIYVFNRTTTIMTDPAPEKLGILVTINRELAAGLRSASSNAAAA